MQIQQANYYKIIGRDTNSLQANTRRAPHDLIMLVIIDPRGRRGRGGEEENRTTAATTTDHSVFIFLPFKSQLPLAASPFRRANTPFPFDERHNR